MRKWPKPLTNCSCALSLFEIQYSLPACLIDLIFCFNLQMWRSSLCKATKEAKPKPLSSSGCRWTMPLGLHFAPRNWRRAARCMKITTKKTAAVPSEAQGSLLEASLGTWDQAKPDPRCPCQARGYLKTGPTLEYPEHIFFYQLNDIKKTKKNSMILYGTLFCVSNFHCCTNSH